MKRRFRKSIGILLSVLMTATMIPILPVAAASKDYSDVSAGDWFYDAVQYVSDNGLMNGMSDTTFEPQTTMSRAMVVTVLHRVEGEPAPAILSSFKDVPVNTWFTNPVAWASADGIVNGYDADTFGPNDDVTREQIATILFRYAGKKGFDVSKRADLNKYGDDEDVSDWAKDALSWTNAEGLIVGVDDTTLSPASKTTRAQVATILQRLNEGILKPNENPGEQPGENPGDQPGDNPGENPSDEKATFTVTFDYNYDNKGTYKTVDVKDGEKAESVADPTRDGYNFSGWYTEATNGTKYDANKAVTENLKLYAHWTKKSSGGGGGSSGGGGGGTLAPAAYTVTFNSNGGSAVDSQKVTANEKATKPATDPTKEGSTFAGWYSDSTLATVYNFDAVVTKNITLYAKWEENQPADDTIYLPVKATCTWGDETLEVNEWNYDEKGNNVQFSIIGTKDESVFTRTFNEDSCVLKQERVFNYGDDDSEDEDSTEKYITNYEYDENGKLIKEVSVSTGSWITEPDEYIVEYTYDEKGNVLTEHSYNTSEYPEDKTTSYVYDNENRAIQITTKEPYTYEGTYYEGVSVYDLTYDSYGNETSRKRELKEGDKYGWRSSTSELTYDDQGKLLNFKENNAWGLTTYVYKTTFEYDDLDNIVKIVENENNREESETWTFEYQAFNKDVLPSQWQEPMYNSEWTHSWTDYYWRYVAREITNSSIGKHSPLEHTVDYNSNGGSVINSQTVTESQIITKPSDPTMDDNTFMGWFVDSDLTTEYDFDMPVNEDLTLYAKWMIHESISDSWDEIIKSVNEGTYKNKYNIGDTKTLELGSEGAVEMQIVAFDADELADGSGTAAITWVSKQVLNSSHQMNLEQKNDVSGWGASELRSWLNSVVKPLIPPAVQNAISPVVKYSVSQVGSATFDDSLKTVDDVWIPSAREIGFSYQETSAPESAVLIEADGPVYSMLCQSENRIKYRLGSTDPVDWGLRSSMTSSGTFRYVRSNGTVGSREFTSTNGVVLGFCLGKTSGGGGGSVVPTPQEASVVTSKNLTLTNVSAEYEAGIDPWNDGAIGFQNISGIVTGPSNVSYVISAIISDSQMTESEIMEQLDYLLPLWKEEFTNPGETPSFTFYGGHSVSELNKTYYETLVGVDSNFNYVGYAIVKSVVR